jgi:hypothetical protein
MTERNNFIFSSNKKPYGIIFLLGIVGGVMLYHQIGKTIDKYAGKLPYWNKLPSYYAASEYY